MTLTERRVPSSVKTRELLLKPQGQPLYRCGWTVSASAVFWNTLGMCVLNWFPASPRFYVYWWFYHQPPLFSWEFLGLEVGLVWWVWWSRFVYVLHSHTVKSGASGIVLPGFTSQLHPLLSTVIGQDTSAEAPWFLPHNGHQNGTRLAREQRYSACRWGHHRHSACWGITNTQYVLGTLYVRLFWSNSNYLRLAGFERKFGNWTTSPGITG